MTLKDLRRLSEVDTLTEARDLLVSEGWVQGVYADPRLDDSGICRRCALGALRQVNIHDDARVFVRGECQDTLLTAMRQVDSDAGDGVLEFHSIIQWNDHPTRTKEQVIEAFNLAIDIAQAQEV